MSRPSPTLETAIEPGTKFTYGFVLSALAPGIDVQDVKSFESSPVRGNGFLSSIHRVRFEFSACRPAVSVILKVPSLSLLLENQWLREEQATEHFLPILTGFHDQEVKFYERVASRHPKFYLPAVFAAKRCASSVCLDGAFILMDDLSDGERAGIHADIISGLTNEQVESVIGALAEFHASSLAFPDELTKEMRMERPLVFTDSEADDLFDKLVALPTRDHYFKRHEKSLKTFIEDARSAVFFGCHEVFNTRPVLSHGDFWANNVLFERAADSGGPGSKLRAIVDWQCAHPNTGMNDFAHFLMSAVSPQLKEAKLADWLHLYHQRFAQAVEELGTKAGDNPYADFSLLERIYEWHCPAQLMFAMVLLVQLRESMPNAGDWKAGEALVERMIYGFDKLSDRYDTARCE